jgi:hypothetical protein
MNFAELVNAHGRTMSEGAPPVLVAHPKYGALGTCAKKNGFVPVRNRWSSAKAIMCDASRSEVEVLRKFEDKAPGWLASVVAGIIKRDPMTKSYLVSQLQKLNYWLSLNEGAIASYDNIVTSRGNGTGHDYFMQMTATLGGVTLMWYDSWVTAWTPGSVPSVTAYTNGATGGAVMNAASNGSWLDNASGSTKKYIVSMGLTTPNITGFTLAMLVDNLWAGSYVITSNATINPTTDVAVTRYASSALAGGNMMMCVLASTLTHTVAGTITTSYTAQDDSTKTTISICPATGPLINRVIFNTLHNSATVVASTPFMPLSNGGGSGVKSLQQVVISGGTITAGSIVHKIVRPLIIMPFIAANSYIEQDTTLNIGNMVELVNVSQVCGCLGFLVFTGGTTATTMSAMIRTAEN